MQDLKLEGWTLSALRENNSSRNIATLAKTSSTSRVFNALKVFQENFGRSEDDFQPIFQCRALNKCIIVKHTLRAEERHLYEFKGSIATKLIFPFDPGNLNTGGKFVFVGQRNWMDVIDTEVGADPALYPSDFAILQLFGGIPSFDPFLLKEWLAREGYRPHEAYFGLSNVDIQKMESFVFTEVSDLVSNAFKGSVGRETILKLVRKLLSSYYDVELEPLRVVLGLSHAEFQDGLFAWKGFLYYKWMAKLIHPMIPRMTAQMGKILPRRQMDADDYEMLARRRREITQQLVMLFNSVADCVALYNSSFSSFRNGTSAKAFRDFLLDAPNLFIFLGEKMGVMSHVIHQWQYRMRAAEGTKMTTEEIYNLFNEFCECLNAVAPDGYEPSQPDAGSYELL